MGEGPDKARQLRAARADWARLETSGPGRDIRHRACAVRSNEE